MLPNFLCIGAQKSGTTTLLRQLGDHPDIFMSPARETKFFLYDHLYSQGATAYELDYFADWNAQKAVGEKTPEYLCDPDVPERIHETLGTQVKLVVSFRSPAQRAYAHYRHNFQHLLESVGFEEALNLEQERSRAGKYQRSCYGYLWRGFYAEQVERYLRLFPRESLFCIVYEQDIVQKQADTLKSLFGFLGVDAGFKPAADVSAGRAKTMIPAFIERDTMINLPGLQGSAKTGDLLFTREGIKPRLIRQPSAALSKLAKAALEHLPNEMGFPRDMELEINRRHFSDDIHRLEKITRRDLKLWLD
jgi:hypothetical protein